MSQWFWKSWKIGDKSDSWLSQLSTHRTVQHYQATRRWQGLPLGSHLHLFAFKDGRRLSLEITQASHSPVCSYLKHWDSILAYRWSDLNWLWQLQIVLAALCLWAAAVPALCWGRMVHSGEEHLAHARPLVCYGHLGSGVCHLCLLLRVVFYCFRHQILFSSLSSMAQSIRIPYSPTDLGQWHSSQLCLKVWHRFHCASGMLGFVGLGALDWRHLVRAYHLQWQEREHLCQMRLSVEMKDVLAYWPVHC